ncbi:CdaR family protein [Halobacillus sp. Cin3]|uniref:CdaR family protein n=1 Tax=Halobacillus sp. Cin3 TaxID=2928441 RepID=UPI00248E9F37|nr:CdaR family protein [Halobacillus sp. Cin3]
MDNWFKSVWFIRIISLLLAGLLWVTVNVDNNMDSDSLFFNETSSESETMENIPLEIRFDSEEYVVSGIPQDVTVTVEGPAGAVAPVSRQKNFNVFVDLNDLGPGTHEVSLQHSGISSQLAVSLEPKIIEVEIEEKTTENYDVSIDYANENNLDTSLELGTPKVSPAQVEITGAASVVERVASVRAIVDVGAAEGTVEQEEAPVKVYDNQGNELNVLVEPAAVDVSVPVSKRTKEVPVTPEASGGTQEGVLIEEVTTEVENVTYQGPEEVLAGIEEPVEIPVDVTEVTEDQVVDVEVPLPDGTTAVSPDTIEVTIDVLDDQQGE